MDKSSDLEFEETFQRIADLAMAKATKPSRKARHPRMLNADRVAMMPNGWMTAKQIAALFQTNIEHARNIGWRLGLYGYAECRRMPDRTTQWRRKR